MPVWQNPPPPSPPRRHWLAIAALAVATAVVVAVTATATVLLSGPSDAATTAAIPASASAADTGPVTVITIEPTCPLISPINAAISDTESNSGWSKSRKDLPARAQWTAAQVTMVESVANAMRTYADQIAPLTAQTPYRWVRETYEQLIAYYRAYADKIATYTPADNSLAAAAVTASNVISRLCEAITDGSATRTISTPPAPTPASVAPPANPANPPRVLTATDPLCAPWQSYSDAFNAATPDWQNLDDTTPATQWTPDQRTLNQAAMTALSTWAQQMNDAATKTTNPALQDFAYATAQYIATAASTGDTYVNGDRWLLRTGYALNQFVHAACRSVTT